MNSDLNSTRLDKWLWAARFFKHRTGATEAVDGGKVRLNGHPAKPAKDVRAGDRIEISIGEQLFVVEVLAIADKRGPASVAQTLYAETPESLEKRQQQREMRTLSAPPGADLHGRPTKRDRRRIERFGGSW